MKDKNENKKFSKLGENITAVYVVFWTIAVFFMIPTVNSIFNLKPGATLVPNLIIFFSCLILAVVSFLVPFIAKKYKKENMTIIKEDEEQSTYEKSKEYVRKSNLVLNRKVDEEK